MGCVYVQRNGSLVVDSLVGSERDAGSGCYRDGGSSGAGGAPDIATEVVGGEGCDGRVVGDRADVLVERSLSAVRSELLEHVCCCLLV
jgi:hypothetical protein